MAKYYVLQENPFFKRGAIVEDDEDGMLQEVYMGREGAAGYIGFMFPLQTVRPYLVRLQNRGLDKFQGGALG